MEKLSVQSMHPFQIVEFGKKVSKSRRSLDCVPTKWINFDKTTRHFVSKFMPPPYNGKTIAALETYVKNEMDAPSQWPVYNVRLVGHGSK